MRRHFNKDSACKAHDKWDFPEIYMNIYKAIEDWVSEWKRKIKTNTPDPPLGEFYLWKMFKEFRRWGIGGGHQF